MQLFFSNTLHQIVTPWRPNGRVQFINWSTEEVRVSIPSCSAEISRSVSCTGLCGRYRLSCNFLHSRWLRRQCVCWDTDWDISDGYEPCGTLSYRQHKKKGTHRLIFEADKNNHGVISSCHLNEHIIKNKGRLQRRCCTADWLQTPAWSLISKWYFVKLLLGCSKYTFQASKWSNVFAWTCLSL